MRGLQWIYDNHRAANVRVVNISMASSIPTSYRTSPVNAAVEQLWRAGVTVVASAGNKGSDRDATWYAPGNHPLVITVGALDDAQTVSPSDDRLATFSSRGIAQDGFSKPDVVAPGRRIVSVLSQDGATLAKLFPDRVTADKQYIRLSGTSMSAPIVTGAIALLLERFPHLTPDQLKGLLVGSARRYVGQVDQAGAVDVAQAMQQAARGSFVAAAARRSRPSLSRPATVSATQAGRRPLRRTGTPPMGCCVLGRRVLGCCLLGRCLLGRRLLGREQHRRLNLNAC